MAIEQTHSLGRQTESDREAGELSYQNMLNNHIVDELARIFSSPHLAANLLDRIRFPEGQRPLSFDTSISFWQQVCRLIDHGVMPEGGFEQLITHAAQVYPGNRVFNQCGNAIQRRQTAPDTMEEGINISLAGWDAGNVSLAEVEARVIACGRTAGISQRIERTYVNDSLLSFFIVNGDVDTARQLRTALMNNRQHLGDGIEMSYNPNLRFRDYLVHQVFAEGPDQGRFILSNVPASTTMREIGNAISAQYDGGLPQNAGHAPRNLVLDRVRPDGTTERINNPDSTLHDNNIRENDTVHGSLESTAAAAVNPIIRQGALARVKLEILEFAESNPAIKLQYSNSSRPFEYLLSFEANGWRPGPMGETAPVRQRDHLVSLFFDEDFPVSAPQVYWHTPFFHPNVNPREGKVCLGELSDLYRPGLHLGKLCLIILDIANYRNYQVKSYLNGNAAAWAGSEQGQQQIKEWGGVLLHAQEKETDLPSFERYLKVEKI